MENYIHHIYDPQVASEILKLYPKISSLIKETSIGKHAVKGFPKASKDKIAIFSNFSRAIKQQRIPILNSLEYCLDNSWYKRELFTTESKNEYESLISEMFLAKCFLLRSYKTESIRLKKGEKGPDLKVKKDEINAVLEVYSPRLWDGLDDFLDELFNSVMNLEISNDCKKDFECDIKIDLLNTFDSGGQMNLFNPWLFSKENSDNYGKIKLRRERIDHVLCRIIEHLPKSNSNFQFSVNYEDLNLKIEVKLKGIKDSIYNIPLYDISRGGPSNSVNDEFLFSQFLNGRALKEKIKYNQLSFAPADCQKILAIDVRRLFVSAQLLNFHYLETFVETVKSCFKSDKIEGLDKIDIVVFYYPEYLGEILLVPLIYFNDSSSSELAKRMFGGTREMISYTDNILITKYDDILDRYNEAFHKKLMKSVNFLETFNLSD